VQNLYGHFLYWTEKNNTFPLLFSTSKEHSFNLKKNTNKKGAQAMLFKSVTKQMN
jgi:hypothetical protein